jgi:type II secretory pathway pseudopilin PulG
MSNVLIGLIGVILLIGLALAGALFLGDSFGSASQEAQAARLMQEGSQISQAFELYGLDKGEFPSGTSAQKIQTLVSTGYLKTQPSGGTTTSGTSTGWVVDNARGAALTTIGSDAGSQKVCKAARAKLGFSDPIKACDAADIAANDPCCTLPTAP